MTSPTYYSSRTVLVDIISILYTGKPGLREVHRQPKVTQLVRTEGFEPAELTPWWPQETVFKGLGSLQDELDR